MSTPPVSSKDPPDFQHFWRGLLAAAATEPREAESIRGASGIAHPIHALGVDESQRRLLVVSNEADARSAAMAQADIQAAIAKYNVLLARPILVDLAQMAEAVTKMAGKPAVDLSSLSHGAGTKQEDVEQAVQPYIEQLGLIFMRWFENARGVQSFSVGVALTQALRQLSNLELSTTEIKLGGLMKALPGQEDRDFGICALPIYAFSGDEMESIHSGADLDLVRQVLRAHNVFQYFYPAADHLALGLVDRGATQPEQILEQLTAAPKLGHPYGPAEIAPTETSLTEIVEELQSRKLLVEGEVGFEVTPEGQSKRATVRFKPREGLLSKLINRISVNIDLKDLFK